MLEGYNNWKKRDTRIEYRQSNRQRNTSPSVAPADFAGDYHSDMYGTISIVEKGNAPKLVFEHSPGLTATLSHWHHDVWEIKWDYPQAWFSFGTIQIKTDNNVKVVGFDFDVPNDDFFFEELKPYRLKSR